MMLRKWEELPSYMQNEEVRKYYDILAEHQGSLIAKRCFDIVFSILLLVVQMNPSDISRVCSWPVESANVRMDP